MRSPSPSTAFDEWIAEREDVEAALDRTPESEEDARNLLFDRAHALERLILETPGDGGAAIRAKSRMIRWLMEMEQADELPAMREVEAFVERLVCGSTALAAPESHDGVAPPASRSGSRSAA